MEHSAAYITCAGSHHAKWSHWGHFEGHVSYSVSHGSFLWTALHLHTPGMGGGLLVTLPAKFSAPP